MEASVAKTKAFEAPGSPRLQLPSALCLQQVRTARVSAVSWESCREEPAPHQKNCTGERDLDLSEPKLVHSSIV